VTDTIRLTSVHGGMSYVPEFLARELGYFEDEGLDVVIKNHGLGPWAAGAVIDGEAEIGMGGMWRPLMYRRGLATLSVFAQMCNRCHSNIVGRTYEGDLRLEDLREKVVLIPSGAPSQGVFLKGLLRRHGVDPCTVRFIYDFVGEEARALFEGGLGDFILATSPEAEGLEHRGAGKVVGPLSKIGGLVPWSIYYARPDWLAANQEIAGRFARAIQRGREWAEQSEAAEAIRMTQSYFPNVASDVLVDAFKAVRSRDIWSGTVVIEDKPQARWQEMLTESSIIEAPVPYAEFYDPGPALWAVGNRI
jgi:NitT/TauT family transport system substrate-binding protein